MNVDLTIFKAYDVRGVYPGQVNAEVVYAITQAYAQFIAGHKNKTSGEVPLKIAVGADMRLCGEEFRQALIKGLTESGADVVDLGLVSTDMFYFGVYHLGLDGGLQATASHNPKEYGGLKMVREKAAPISGDSGIYEIRDLVVSNQKAEISNYKGKVEKSDITEQYFKHVLSFFDTAKFKNFKVVANANYGMGNLAINYLQSKLPIKFVKVVYEGLNGEFPLPLGRPDPLVPENRQATVQAIHQYKPDLGVAWDADADRCFFFDEQGQFVTPAYINALLSEYYLQKYPGGKILHDTRVVRVIDYMVEKNGGMVVMNKAGHSFIKERMIKDDIVFGTETSGHYYFKENFYLDNGLFPFLAILDILSKTDKTFSEILEPLREKFFISEEINFKVNDAEKVFENFRQKYTDAHVDEVDGLDFNFPSWRFNVRKSNTEPLLRLNVEADSKGLLEQKEKELSEIILAS